MPRNESLNVNAKTVDLAIEQGLRQLGLGRDEVEITVIKEGKRGVFGLGAEDAHIVVTPRHLLETDAEPTAVAPVVDESHDDEPVDDVNLDVTEPDAEDTGDGIPNDDDQDDIASDDDSDSSDDVNGYQLDIPLEQLQEISTRHLAALLAHMGIQADIEPKSGAELADDNDAPPLVLDITGADLGVLIGRQSETLHALQYMLRLMISKELKSWYPVVVDVESYRLRRQQSLRQIALQMAERAISNGRRVVLESMPAYERRIVHIVLKDHPDVFTRSIGTGNNRKVTIIPK